MLGRIMTALPLVLVICACKPSGNGPQRGAAIKPILADSVSPDFNDVDYPKVASGGETISPYGPEQVRLFQKLADKGDLEAREKLFSHYSFEHDLDQAEIHLHYLFDARRPVALEIMAGRLQTSAYRRADTDPLKLCELLEAATLFSEYYVASKLKGDAPGDIYRAEEIARLEKLLPQTTKCE